MHELLSCSHSRIQFCRFASAPFYLQGAHSMNLTPPSLWQVLPQFIYFICSSSLCTPIQMSYFWALSPAHCHRESSLLIFHCWQLYLCLIVQLGIWGWSLGNANTHAHMEVCKILAALSPQNFKIYFIPLFSHVVQLRSLFHYCHLAHVFYKSFQTEKVKTPSCGALC